MDEEDKKAIVQSLNLRIGGDINDLASALQLETELAIKREKLQSSVSIFFTDFFFCFLSCRAVRSITW